MASMKKTLFNKLWLDHEYFPEFSSWLEEVKGAPNQAACKICKNSFYLSNMGRQALVSHTRSSRHKMYASRRQTKGQGSLMSYLVKPSTTVNEAATVIASASEVSKSTPSAADELTTQTSSTG